MANNEWGTPSKYIESSRKVMGSIDTDPASNDKANITIKSLIYYTKEKSGLDNPWYGNVWLNPPYGRGLALPFLTSLIEQYDEGYVSSAILLTNAVYDIPWWNNTVSKYCSAICLPDHRIAFINPTTDKPEKSNNKTQLFTYLGNNPDLFCEEFTKHGLCVIPQRPVPF